MTNLADLQVFIVDDDNYCRELLHSLLLMQGFVHIRQFDNGVDCINNLSQQPDIIFLDYNMDPINGLDVLKTAKKICPETIFMMVSAQKDMQVAINAMKAGATDYIVKDENVGANLCNTISNISNKIIERGINKIDKTRIRTQSYIPAQSTHPLKVTKMKSFISTIGDYTSVKISRLLGVLLLISSLFLSTHSIAQTPITWYQDHDGDGFGNPAVVISSSVQPTGYVGNNLDCNDNSVTAGAWSYLGSSAGIASASGYNVGFCLDHNNKAYMGCAPFSYAAAAYSYSEGVWTAITSSTLAAAAANYMNVVADNNNNIYFSYEDNNMSQKPRLLEYSSSGVWSDISDGASFLTTGSQYNSLALDASGNPYIAFQERYSSTKATVIKYVGGTWSLVGPEAFTSGSASYTSIAINSANTPYVVYSDAAASISGKASVMFYNATTAAWTFVGAEGLSAGSTSYDCIAIDRFGNPIVAFADGSGSYGGKVTVMKYSSGSWSILGTAGFSSGAATYLSLTLDVAGVPVVSYQDASLNKLAVMKYNSASNTWANVVSSGISTGATSYGAMAMSTEGMPYVAYIDGTTSKVAVQSYGPASAAPGTPTVTASGSVSCSSSSVTLSVTAGALNDATSWNWYSGSCGGTYVGTGTSINVTVGSTTAFYCRGEGNCLSNPGNCGSVTVSSSSSIPSIWYRDYDNDGWGSATVYETSCTPPAGYVANNEDCNDSSFTSSAWSYLGATGVSSYTGANTAMAIDKTSNIPYIFFQEAQASTNYGSVMKYNGSSWSYVGAAQFTTHAIDQTSMAISSAGVPYVAFRDNNYQGSVMTYNSTTAAWQFLGSESFTSNGCTYTSMAVDPSGNPYMAFTDGNVSSKVSVYKYTNSSSSWGYVGAEGVSTTSATYNSLAIDKSGNLYLAYVDGSASKATIKKYNGSTWSTLGTSLSTGNASYTSITLDTAGIPYIVYVDANTNKPSVAKYNSSGSPGGSWASLGTGISTGTATSTTIAVDYSGAPYISYKDGGSGKAVVMKYNTTAGTWSAAGSAISSGSASTPAIILDKYGVPIVGLQDAGYSNKAVVYKLGPSVPVAPTTPTLTATATTVSCGGNTTLSIAGGALNGASGWYYYSGGCGTGYIGTGTSLVVTPSVTTTYYARAEGNCLNTPGSCGNIVITRSGSNPVVGNISGTSSFCAGTNTTFTDTTTGGTWSSGNTSIATVSTGGVVTGIAAGSVAIVYTKSNSCGSTSSVLNITVTSGSASTVTISGNYTVCPGGTSTLTTSVSGGTWSSSAPGVATVSASNVLTGITSGSANITYTVMGSCGTSTAVATAVVTSPPAAATISGTYTVCPGGTTTLSVSATGGTWSSSAAGTASVSASGVVSGIVAGPAIIYYKLTNSCGATTTSSVSVTVNPSANAGTISGTYTICPAAITTLTTTVTGGTWSSSAPAVATVSASNVLSGIASGTANITYAVTNSCGTATVSAAVTITSPPAAAAISGTYTVCPGGTTTLSVSATGGTWSSSAAGTASVSASGVVSGIVAGPAIIYYKLTNSCGATTTSSVSVTVNPSANAGTISGTYTICPAATTTLTTTVTGGTWSSSAPAVATVSASNVLTGIASGTANITYAVTNSCGTATVSAAVTITSPPAAATISGTYTLCPGATTTLSVSVTGGTWSTSAPGSAASVSSTGVVTGMYAGSAVLSYKLTNTCGAVTTSTVTITVNPAPTAGTISGTYTVCPDATTTLTTSVTGGTWSSSAPAVATVSASNVLTGIASGTANISYSATNSCGTATVSATVTVNPLPNAGSISGTYTLCPATTTTLTTTGSGGTWVSSATTVATVSSAGVVRGLIAGNAVITYSVTNSCGTSTVSATVTVNPSPNAGAISGTYSLCPGNTTALTVNGNSGGTWSSSAVAVATVSTAGVVRGLTQGVANITYSVTNSCGTATVAATVTVNPLPNAGTISGTYSLCPATTTTLTTTGSGGTWSSSATSVATVSNVGVVKGLASGNAGIIYSVTNSCGTASVSATVNVNPLPNAGTISGTYTVCPGGTTNFSTTATVGAWSSSASGIATVSATGLVTGIAVGTASISYTTSNSCGTASAYSVVTVNALPDAGTISGVTSLCVASSITLSDAASSGTWTSNNTSVASVSAAGVVSGIATGTATISYMVTTACGSATTFAPVTVINQGTWLGTANADWNNTANWPCGLVPTSSIDVTIPSGTAYAPTIISGTAAARNITIDSGVVVTIDSGAILDIKRNLVNGGTITGTNGTITLTGTATQTIYGATTLYNLQVSNTGGAIINAGDSLKIKGTLTLTAGTFTTNNMLILFSDAGGTGRIGTITGGAITGNVTVQQYVIGGRRAYRFWGHPFSAYIPFTQITQSIDITGTGGVSNGFTTTVSNASSCYWYNTAYGNSSLGSDPGWRALTNTSSTVDSNQFKPYEGVRLYIRGDKGEGLDGSTYTVSGVTISMNGPVNTGDINEPMHLSALSDYNLLSNPYPSPINLGAVVNNAKTNGTVTGAAFYVWNPYVGTSGAFVPELISSTPYYIEANTSFEVRTTADGNQLSFTETNKSAAGSAVLLRNQEEYISLQVYDTSYHEWDMMYLNFNNNATDNNDKDYDATKPSNPDLNFYSLSADNRKLSVDARPYNAGKIIPLGFTTNYAQQYIIKATSFVAPDGGNVYLHDKYLGKKVLLQQGTEYRFAITIDSASQGNNRFELGLGEKEQTVAATVTDVQMIPNPASDNVTISYDNATAKQTSISIMSLTGVVMFTKDLGIQQSGKTDIALDGLASGVYLVEFTAGSDKKVKRLVKE